MILVVGAVLAGAGCGTNEEALKLAAVKAGLHAGELGKLHVLTQQGGYNELRKNGFPTDPHGPADGPDYLQDPVVPTLMVVRYGTVDGARRAVPKMRLERHGRFAVRVARVCNVVIANFTPTNAGAQSRADRVMKELRDRCGT